MALRSSVYTQKNPDAHCTDEMLGRAFSSISEDDRKEIYKLAKEWPDTTRDYIGKSGRGIGPKGMQEILAKLALLKLSSTSDHPRRYDLSLKNVLVKAVKKLE